jgi:hypothetical protein
MMMMMTMLMMMIYLPDSVYGIFDDLATTVVPSLITID